HRYHILLVCRRTLAGRLGYRERSFGTRKSKRHTGYPTLFEDNVQKPREALSTLTKEQLSQDWTMTAGDHVVLGPMPRGIVARGFLFNHVYHHRGEMIVYLRATGNKVPGLYGPTYEDGTA